MIPKRDRKRLTEKSLSDLQRIAKTEGNSWRAELGHLARHASESTYKIGLLHGATSGDISHDVRKALLKEAADTLSSTIIDIVFIAADLGIDLAHKLPEVLYERILENHDERAEILEILEGKGA